MYHRPVLVKESLEGLAIKPGGTYADLTFGGGGHSMAILEKLGNGRLIVFDSDADAAVNLPDDDRITFVNHNFRYLTNFLRYYDALPVDGIFADLGVSSWQFDTAQKGFSTRFDAPLDLRMNALQVLNASTIVNTWEEARLAALFKEYGELPNAKAIARCIAERRTSTPIERTGQLTELLSRFTLPHQSGSFYARVFQALRIVVNDELGALKEMLQQSLDVLAPGGRIVVIAYHSLEDRLVKNFFKSGNLSGVEEKDFFGNIITPFTMITRKPLMPTEGEKSENNRARSARLRIAERRPT